MTVDEIESTSENTNNNNHNNCFLISSVTAPKSPLNKSGIKIKINCHNICILLNQKFLKIYMPSMEKPVDSEC